MPCKMRINIFNVNDITISCKKLLPLFNKYRNESNTFRRKIKFTIWFCYNFQFCTWQQECTYLVATSIQALFFFVFYPRSALAQYHPRSEIPVAKLTTVRAINFLACMHYTFSHPLVLCPLIFYPQTSTNANANATYTVCFYSFPFFLLFECARLQK